MESKHTEMSKSQIKGKNKPNVTTQQPPGENSSKGDSSDVPIAPDSDLDFLLDSALDDFDRLSVNTKSKTSTRLSSGSNDVVDELKLEGGRENLKESKSRMSEPLEGIFNSDPQYAKLDEMLRPIIDSDPQLKDHWDKLTESCNKAANAKSDEEFTASFTETLQNLTQSAQSISSGPLLDEEEMAKIWANLGAATSGGDDDGKPNVPPDVDFSQFFQGAGGANPFGDLVPLLTNMMQNFLSKELLYPALKDLTQKYPVWLSENGDKISCDDLKRYRKQLDLMNRVCNEYDSEKDTDEDSVKKERFKKILELMQEMQKCGSPPSDLVADIPEMGASEQNLFGSVPGGLPGMPLNFPNMPPGGPDGQQCHIM